MGDIRSDSLVHNVIVSSSILSISTLADSVDLVIDGSSVVVTVLTGTGNSPLDVRRMPRPDTSDLSETLVCFSWQLLGAPSARHTCETVTLGNSDSVDHLILLEDGVDLDWLLEQTVAKVDFICCAATVNLDLHKVGLLLRERGLGDLSVGEDPDNGAVFLDPLDLSADGGALLSVLLGVLGEGLLLGLVPVLVKASLQLVAQVLCPDGGEGSESSWGFDVADEANGDHLGHCQILSSLVDFVVRKYLTGGVSTTVTASTISFLCILAPGRSRSRTMVVMPAL